MTAAFNVVGLDHVTITAPEDLIQEVATWYRDCFGLSAIDRPEGARASSAWFSVGDQEIHISADPHNPPKTSHFCLLVDDFAAAVERLRANNTHIEQAPGIPGRRRCFVRDPAGNQVEVAAVEGSA